MQRERDRSANANDFQHCWQVKEINDENLHAFHSFHRKIGAGYLQNMHLGRVEVQGRNNANRQQHPSNISLVVFPTHKQTI